MLNWEANIKRIARLYQVIEKPPTVRKTANIKVGVDLGTALIGLIVVDESGEPLAGCLEWASALRDGLVVDYLGAVEVVARLKEKAEKLLDIPLTEGATAIPPGTEGNNAAVCGHILEAAGLNLTKIMDEPTAAAIALGIQDGAVVDVGGGTTGISILRDGQVIYTGDEPTGGTHLTLVVAGSHGISYEEAELLKRDEQKHRQLLPVLIPVIQKMAQIAKNHIAGYPVDKIYLVGGAASIAGFEKIFADYIGLETIKPDHPMLVTPLGIALNGK
jgi:ethanolamine utilization protein EutJ